MFLCARIFLFELGWDVALPLFVAPGLLFPSHDLDLPLLLCVHCSFRYVSSTRLTITPQKLKDGTIPELKQASDNRDSGPGGRGRGRGGRGGGFMQRGFAAAGLAPGGGRGRGGKE